MEIFQKIFVALLRYCNHSIVFLRKEKEKEEEEEEAFLRCLPMMDGPKKRAKHNSASSARCRFCQAVSVCSTGLPKMQMSRLPRVFATIHICPLDRGPTFRSRSNNVYRMRQ